MLDSNQEICYTVCIQLVMKGVCMQPEQDRFLRKVFYDPVTECWEWHGSKYRKGYGHFRRKINNKWVMYKAHRYAYEFYNGPIPSGAFVCHHCDNTSCVNPAHLFTGTALDNTLDMIAKKRKGIIRNSRHNLLNMDIAKAIREFHKENKELTQKEISVVFKTSPAQISRILNNQIWQEVL